MFLRTHVTLNYTKSSKSPFFRKRHQDKQTLLKLLNIYFQFLWEESLFQRTVCALSVVRCEQVKKHAARPPVRWQGQRKQEGTAGTRGFLRRSVRRTCEWTADTSWLGSPDFSLFKDVVAYLTPPDRADILQMETLSLFHVWTCLFSITSPYRMLLRCWQKAMNSACWRGNAWLSGELHLSWRVFPLRCRAWRQLTTCRVWGNMPRQSWM